MQLGLHRQHTGHDRRLGLDGELQKILNAACRNVDVEVDGVPLPFLVDDRTAARKFRGAQLSLYRLQIRIAGRPAANGRESSEKGYGVVCGIKAEIRHIRCSSYFDPVEAAGELPIGMEYAAYSLDGA